jgi:class 3 adenylate cyclase
VTVSLLAYLPRLVVDWHREMRDVRACAVDGTLVFVDIAGFTAMSERLARKGRVGSEEVTEVLKALFRSCWPRPMRTVAGCRSSVGDALLLFFLGHDHELRGVHAAAMRRTLREMGGARTSAGFVHLRMSIGLHSGSFNRFLVGDRHRELVLAGPAVTTTVLMEHAATADEILMSPATAAALEPTLLGKVDLRQLLRRRAGSPAPDRSGLASSIAAASQAS